MLKKIFQQHTHKWNDAGIPGYQQQSRQVLTNLVEQFNQPEYIPVLSELFSKMLVMCAEKNFDTTCPSSKPRTQGKTYFSREHKMAYIRHEKVCNDWRKQGRPKEASHRARIAKLESQRS